MVDLVCIITKKGIKNMENKTTLTGPRIYQKGEGAGKFIKSHYLGYFPESKLMYAMLIAALGGMMFLVMEESLMGSAMSGGLADSLNASPNTMSWVLSSVSLGTICGFPLAGPIADKIGRRALVLLGLLGYVICDIFQMLCLNIPSFLIARFCSGMVGMFTIAPTLAMVRDYTPRVNRGMGYGLSLALGWGGGGLLTFFMGGTILSTFAGRTLFGMEGDWRWIFYIAGILALVIFVIELLVLKDIHPMLRLRQRGFSLEDASEMSDSFKESDINDNGSLRDAMKYYFKSKRMWLIWSNQYFTTMTWTTILTFMPTILMAMTGTSAANSNYLTVLLYSGFVIFGLISGWFIDKFHARKFTSFLWMWIEGICMLLLGAFCLKGDVSMTLICIVLFFLGAASSSLTPSFNTVLSGEAERINPQGVSSAFAFYLATTAVLNFIPQFACPRLLEITGTWATALFILGALCIIGSPTLVMGGRGPFKPTLTLTEE